MRRFVAITWFAFLAGCGQPTSPTQSAPEPAPQPGPQVAPPVLLRGSDQPLSADDVKKLSDAVRPLGWQVNDLPEDANPRPVNAAFVRSRSDRKTEEDFAKLAKVLAETGIPVILDLGYVGTPATDAWVKHIAGSKAVVGFRASAGVTKKSITDLAKMSWLEWLRVLDDSLTDADVVPLAGLTKLKILEIEGQHKLTRASYALLAKMTDLRRFRLFGLYQPNQGATDEDLAYLSELTKLEELMIEVRQVSDAGLARLKPLTGLHRLIIRGFVGDAASATDAAFNAFAGMEKLEEFGFEPRVPPVAFAKLAPLTNLRKVAFSPSFSPGDVARFTEQIGKLTQLREIVLKDHSDLWTDEALAHLKAMVNLTRFELVGSKLTDAGIAHLAGMKELKNLNLGGVKGVTGAATKHLVGLTKLEMLVLDSVPLSDEDAAHLKGLTLLRFLSLSGSKITDAGVEHLAGLTKLERLFLEETQITDACVSTLKQLPKLSVIHAEKTKMTQKGANELKASLPGVRVSVGE